MKVIENKQAAAIKDAIYICKGDIIDQRTEAICLGEGLLRE